MNDIRTPKESQPVTKKDKSLTIKVNRTMAVILGVVLLVVVAFFLGKAYGASQERKPSSRTTNRNSSTKTESNRWTSVGNVTEISDSKIKVKDSRNETKEAIISKDTKIVNSKGETLKVSDIKNDQRVIVSGEKDDKGALTATRIRLQK